MRSQSTQHTPDQQIRHITNDNRFLIQPPEASRLRDISAECKQCQKNSISFLVDAVTLQEIYLMIAARRRRRRNEND